MNNEETNNAQTTAPSTKPVRRTKKLLDPNWFQATCQLAIKHGTNLIFTEDRVWGVSVKHGHSVWVEYPPNGDWCEEISRIFAPASALGQFGDTNDNSALKPYAKLDLDESSKCYVDDTTFLVHTLGANGVKLKSGTFTGCPFMEAPEHAPEVNEFVYSEAVSKEAHEMIVSCLNANESRMALRRANSLEIDGVNGIVATDGRGLVRVVPKTDLPHSFNFEPCIVNASDVVGFMHRTDEKELELNHYKMTDGVVLTETLPSDSFRLGRIAEIISGAFSNPPLGTVDGEFLKSCYSQIDKLGVGSKCVNRRIRFTKGKMEFQTENGVLLSFDGSVELPENAEVNLSYERKCLRTFAKFGLPLNLANKNPATYKDDDFLYLVMPLIVDDPKEASETTDEN